MAATAIHLALQCTCYATRLSFNAFLGPNPHTSAASHIVVMQNFCFTFMTGSTYVFVVVVTLTLSFLTLPSLLRSHLSIWSATINSDMNAENLAESRGG